MHIASLAKLKDDSEAGVGNKGLLSSLFHSEVHVRVHRSVICTINLSRNEKLTSFDYVYCR